MAFSFRCASCDAVHYGMPALGAPAPDAWYSLSEHERASRTELSDEECIIDEKRFFVRGLYVIPVTGEDEPFAWIVWVECDREAFMTWLDGHEIDDRESLGPLSGALNSNLPGYSASTLGVPVTVWMQNGGQRPIVLAGDTHHPIAAEQDGISATRLAEIYAIALHG